MSTFDILLAIPLAYGIFQGFRQGFLQEVVSVVALVLGFLLGLKLLNTVIPVVQGFIGSAYGFLPFISFIIIFGLIIVGVRLLGVALKKILDFTPFGAFDNLLGALLGGLKWCLAVSLLFYVANLAGIGVPQTAAHDSVIYPYVVKSTPLALDVLGFIMPFVKVLFATFKGLF